MNPPPVDEEAAQGSADNDDGEVAAHVPFHLRPLSTSARLAFDKARVMLAARLAMSLSAATAAGDRSCGSQPSPRPPPERDG